MAHLLHEILKERAALSPNDTALAFQKESMTFQQLDYESDKIAFFLRQIGTCVGDRVAIFMNKSMESIVSVFGILKAGASYVPIDPQQPPSRVGYILNSCKVRSVVTSWRDWRKMASLGTDELSDDLNIILKDEGVGDSESSNCRQAITSFSKIMNSELRQGELAAVSDSNPAYILFTSGSTGVPKGVVISHLNAMTFIKMASNFFGIRPEDRIAGHAPLHFDLSVFDIYVAMAQGASLILVPEHLSAFPLRLADFIYEHHISVWNSSASVLSLLADKGKIDRRIYDNMRLVHFSGDVLPPQYLRRLMACMPNAQFFNIYGQTEANSSIYYRVPSPPGDDDRTLPIGKPFPNFEAFLLDEDNRTVEEGEGELYIKSSSVALGYWRDPELTKERFCLDPRNEDSHVRVYRTGDIAYIGADRNYYFKGRKDHMVKSRGYRIELLEIESVIRSHPSVANVVAVAIPDSLIGSKVLALISLVDGESVEENALRTHCSAHLPRYMIPEIFEFRSEMPMTSSGKIDRKTLGNEAIKKYK